MLTSNSKSPRCAVMAVFLFFFLSSLCQILYRRKRTKNVPDFRTKASSSPLVWRAFYSLPRVTTQMLPSTPQTTSWSELSPILLSDRPPRVRKVTSFPTIRRWVRRGFRTHEGLPDQVDLEMLESTAVAASLITGTPPLPGLENEWRRHLFPRQICGHSKKPKTELAFQVATSTFLSEVFIVERCCNELSTARMGQARTPSSITN